MTTKPLTKAQENAARVEDNRRVAYVRKVRTLLGHLVGERLVLGAILAAYKTGQTAEACAADYAAREPVGRAVHPVKAEVVADADRRAREFVAKTKTWCEELGMDAQKVEYNSLRLSAWSPEYKKAQANYQRFHLFTRRAGSGYSYRQSGEADPHVWDLEAVERFVETERQGAALQYDAYIVKLVAKVGDVLDAELELIGGLWSRSNLRVTLMDGSKQRWYTQQIVNFSVLGNAYYQWPTRLMKD